MMTKMPEVWRRSEAVAGRMGVGVGTYGSDGDLVVAEGQVAGVGKRAKGNVGHDVIEEHPTVYQPFKVLDECEAVVTEQNREVCPARGGVN